MGWTPPQQGWYTLNTDGCWQEKENCAGSGGLLRDHRGIWLRGFSVKLGHCTIEEAELWAPLICGLSQAWEEGIRFLISEVDSLNVLNRVSKEGMEGAKYKSLIQECKDLMKKPWSVKLEHVYRAADFMANLSLKKENRDLLQWQNQPICIGEILNQDEIGIKWPRRAVCKTLLSRVTPLLSIQK